jgi:hypothetical protein
MPIAAGQKHSDAEIRAQNTQGKCNGSRGKQPWAVKVAQAAGNGHALLQKDGM